MDKIIPIFYFSKTCTDAYGLLPVVSHNPKYSVFALDKEIVALLISVVPLATGAVVLYPILAEVGE